MTSAVILATAGLRRGHPAARDVRVVRRGDRHGERQPAGQTKTPSRRVTVHRGRSYGSSSPATRPDEFHLHGYDREMELKPGVPGELRFVADQPGVFEAELHQSGPAPSN